jgi:hypothetical protein
MNALNYEGISVNRWVAFWRGIRKELLPTIIATIITVGIIYGVITDFRYFFVHGFLLMPVAAFLLLDFITRDSIRREGWRMLYVRLALQNHLEYKERQDTTALSLSLSLPGTDYRLRDMISGSDSTFWAAIYEYRTAGLRKNRIVSVYTHLLYAYSDQELPHIFLQAIHDSNTHQLFAEKQQLAISELDAYYQVFVPDLYKETIGALLTADVCENLIRLDGRYSVELSGHDIYIISRNVPKATTQQLELEMEALLGLQQALSDASQGYQPPTGTPERLTPDQLAVKRALFAGSNILV